MPDPADETPVEQPLQEASVGEVTPPAPPPSPPVPEPIIEAEIEEPIPVSEPEPPAPPVPEPTPAHEEPIPAPVETTQPAPIELPPIPEIIEATPPPVADVIEPTPATTPPVAPQPVEDSKVEVQSDQVATQPKVEESSVENASQSPPAPSPAIHDPKYTKDIPQKVLELSAEEINAARILWARENIADAQKQANLNRTARMNERMDEIEKIVKAKPQTTTHAVANTINLSTKTTSGYLQKLVHAGRIKASGKSWQRRYFV